MSNTTETYEGISGGVQFLASRIGAAVGGPFGTAYATFLTGQNSWVASATDLVSKSNDGTATWEDYADVTSRTMSTAVAFGVLVGALPEATTLLGLTALASGALTAWKNKDYLSKKAGQLEIPIAGGNDALIAEIQSLFQTASTIDPLILDLNGDGVQTTRLSKSSTTGVHFNLDAKGFSENTAWVDAHDGLLVRDLNGDGKITSGRELFGNYTQLKNGSRAGNGFEALKEIDNNNDGVVDSNDVAFNTLKVWKDLNTDGITDTDELLTLNQAGVKSLKVAYTQSTAKDMQGNAHAQLGNFTTTDGITRNMDDVWFSVDTVRTQVSDLVAVSADIAALPDVAQMGNVRSLHQAMARDQSGQLKNLVQQWKKSSGTARDAILDTLIYLWAGTQNEGVNSRGSYIDARQLAAVEKFLGSDFTRSAGNPSNTQIAQPLKQTYALFRTFIATQLYWQTDAPELLAQLDLKWVDADSKAAAGSPEVTGHFEWDAKDLAENLHSRFATVRAEDGVLDLQLFTATLKHNNLDNVLHALKKQASAYTDTFGALLLHIDELTFVIQGTSVADNLASATPSLLMGWAGNDILRGSGENDILIGGAGNDTLNGGFGNDIYLFNQGDGQDTINDHDFTAGNLDTLQLGAGLTANSAMLGRSGYDLTLSWGADSITLEGYFYGEAYRVEKINFADGTQWGLAGIAAKLIQNGTTSADCINGFKDYDNRINGLDGNDYLYGGNKDDVLSGGDGNDNLSGYAGNDKLEGGAGDDNLDAGSDEDVLLGGEGADSLSGGDGSDTLTGGGGNDFLDGGYGNDTYVFNRGDGSDTISDIDFKAGNADTLQLGAGLLASEVQMSGDLNNLKLSWGSDSLAINNYFSGSIYQIEKINFADGTVWGIADIAAKAVRNGSANVDWMTGFTDFTNQINGLGGNDYLYGGNKDDVLSGGDGNDSLSGYAGNDLLQGGTGDDYLSGSDGADVLLGGEGVDTLSGGYGADLLAGGSGNDSLSGDNGNDTYIFNQGDGADTISDSDYTAGNADTLQLGAGLLASEVQISGSVYDLKLSWGSDSVTISNYFYSYSDAYRIEKISFADGTVWGAADIASKVTRNGSASEDWMRGFNDHANRINGLGGNDYLYGGSKDDVLNGGDGNDNLSGYAGNDLLQGGAGDDYLSGSDGADVLLGGDGADTLSGGYGADLLTGGSGNDSLSGDNGNDTYIFNQGDGADTISDSDYTAGNVDTLQLGAGLLASEVQIGGSVYDLKLSWGSDSVAINNYFNSSIYQIENISFADGTVWRVADIASKVTRNGSASADYLTGLTDYTNRINGLAGNDYIYGGNKDDVLNGGDGNDSLSGYVGNDKLEGGAGDDNLDAGSGEDVLLGGEGADSLLGGAGSDTLSGGTGNDLLDGGYGNDTYVFNLGDGSDKITEYDYTAGNVDTLQLGAGLFASNVQVSRSTDDLKLSWGSDSVTISNYFYSYSDAYRIEKISFEDGTVWGVADIASKVVRNGSASADFLTGLTDYTNQINGLGGNDYLFGGNKDDVLNGGDGNDYLMGDAGNDKLYGGAGNDYLIGGRGADQFTFDSLIVSGSVDTIFDYSSAEGDVIALSSSQMTQLMGKSSLANHFRFSTQAVEGNDDYLVYNRTTGELAYDASGNASANAVIFAVLANKPKDIAAAQFVVL